MVLISGRFECFANEITGDGTIGITLEGNNEHKIGYNYIQDQVAGIVIANSGNNDNLTHCNTLISNENGIFFRGNNEFTQFKYNDFATTLRC
ncbi:hypothetical protein MASR1M65_28520 [Saprospiraceae bacterium]